VARAAVTEESGLFPAMVSPITGQPAEVPVEEVTAQKAVAEPAEAQPVLALADRLANPDSIDVPATVDGE